MSCSRKNKKSRGGSKPLLGTCLTHTAAASQCALETRTAEAETLNKLQNTTGGGKNRRGGENANETCPGIGVSINRKYNSTHCKFIVKRIQVIPYRDVIP